jgi:hypothetical protein
MKFRVNGDNRNGSVSVKSGQKSDPREDTYNIDPSKQYRKFARLLSEQAGAGNGTLAVRLDTSSEFLSYANGECAGLELKSKGTITPPKDPAAAGVGIVQDSIWMNIRIDQPGKVQLTASVVSDLDIAEIMLQGPSFPKPVRIYDEYDQTLDITKPGEYSLRGGYQLSVRFPNSGLGGRPLTVEIEARLTPAS